MESTTSKTYMIDTSSTKVSKKNKQKQDKVAAALTDADILVKKILDDDEEMDEHISAMHLINHFKMYEASLNKFHVSAEDLFEKLSIKNKRIENYEIKGRSSELV